MGARDTSWKPLSCRRFLHFGARIFDAHLWPGPEAVHLPRSALYMYETQYKSIELTQTPRRAN